MIGISGREFRANTGKYLDVVSRGKSVDEFADNLTAG